jgi:hypothetical protein
MFDIFLQTLHEGFITMCQSLYFTELFQPDPCLLFYNDKKKYFKALLV